jgi:Ser/Thr protein kinase RdoA (MazF antagonist)
MLPHDPAKATAPLACADSVVLPEALLEAVLPAYELSGPARCELYNKGLDATYLLEASGTRFMARLYHSRWWQPGEVDYELAALAHLGARGVAVARVVPRPCGELSLTLRAAEGRRSLALFEFIEGQPIDPLRDAFDYGVTAAAIHTHGNGFVSSTPRRRLDLDGVFAAPFAGLLAALEPESRARAYLADLRARVAARIASLEPLAVDQGFCHGDFNFANALRTANGVTLFDFECCAPGLRAYDLAVFRWTQRLVGAPDAAWWAFLEGYQQHRPIHPQDLAAVPLFVLLRQLWLMQHDAERTLVFSNGTRWRRQGTPRNLAFVETLDRELFASD